MSGESGVPRRSSAGETAVVSRVIDGDTVKLSDGRNVRLIGIDTPERGQCGFGPASSNLRQLVEAKPVRLVSGASSDTDKYDRILRYLEIDGTDAGREQLRRGLAIARYDSRDGYGGHPRENDYVAADAANPDPSCTTAQRKSPIPGATRQSAAATRPSTAATPSAEAAAEAVYYTSCTAARKAGAAPLYRGAPGYRVELDRDRNGFACQ